MQNPKPKEPLLLFIDDRPTAKATTIRPNAIVFTRTDELGQKLWKIAHPIPWSTKSRWIRWPVYFVVGLYSLLFTLWYFYRERVPITGRLQFQILGLYSPPPKGTPLKISYDEDVQKVLLADDDPRMMRVRSILDRILSASGQEHLEWKLTVLDCPDIANASITPFGLVLWYSGLFAAAETDDEIAAVLSHEVAHVIAHHADATSSGQLLGILAMLPAAPFILGGMFIQELILPALPPMAIGAMILLALSRKREAEADKIGMLLMTEAGYEPSATVTYWRKMESIEQKWFKDRGRIKGAEYKSTHPHTASRLSQAALDVPKILYMTGKGPLRPGMSPRELRLLEASKKRWKSFLEQRSHHDNKK
ncbi:MAG: hypothetical protein Q9204_002549 [Flavoplaca sp. TL-2023a]